jgi:hypothetical protein
MQHAHMTAYIPQNIIHVRVGLVLHSGSVKLPAETFWRLLIEVMCSGDGVGNLTSRACDDVKLLTVYSCPQTEH